MKINFIIDIGLGSKYASDYFQTQKLSDPVQHRFIKGRICNYLLDNLMMAVSISLKTFCSTTRKCRIRCARFDPSSELGMNHTARIRISYYEIQTYEISFNSLTDNLSHSFVRKNVFYGKNIKYANNFYRTDLNVCRGVFRTQSNIYSGASLWKPQKSFNVDAWLGSK